MGSTINILPILYDENEPHKFKPLKDFNKKEWLTGNNYWFKTLEDSYDIEFNYSEMDTNLFILYNGQSEKIIDEVEYFKNVKKRLDDGIYKRVILFQNEVNWDTFERLLDVEDFFYQIFGKDKKFTFVRNIFNSRFAFTKISAEFGFGCFPFQLVHNYKETEGVDYNVEKKFHLYSANCNVKEDRLHFYSFLDRNKYWDIVNTSFFLPNIQTGQKVIVENYVANLGKLDLNCEYTPKTLKYDVNPNVKSLALKDSLESLFQVIFETRYHSHCGIVLSEKLFKGFLYKTPFLVFAQHGVLDALREMGFYTFDWLIDESYDMEYDNKKRLDMMISEVDKLLKTPMDVIDKKIKEHEYELNWNRERVRIFAQIHIDNIINLFDAE
jgi:hypothetical protein